LLNALPPVEGELQASVIEALRRATAERHRRVEAQVRLDAEFDVGHYRCVLQCFEAFLARWEACITACLPPRLQHWFSERQRLPLLRLDLAALSAPPLVLPDKAFELALPSLAAAFGSLYVMEGSALGGQVIARQLARQHGIGAENGGAYFEGQVTARLRNGANSGSFWIRRLVLPRPLVRRPVRLPCRPSMH
jgi:heme oxygenase